jgi:long-subunit acyl-CoA synthetase (AMP-forming)
MNYVCVPLYETLGDTAIEYILEHGSVKLVVIQGKRLGRLAKALAQVPPMLAVVVWGPAEEADLQVSGCCMCSGSSTRGLTHTPAPLTAQHNRACVRADALALCPASCRPTSGGARHGQHAPQLW